MSDVLLGSLGLAGVLMLCAVLMAAVFAAGLLWWRSRVAGDEARPPEDLHIV